MTVAASGSLKTATTAVGLDATNAPAGAGIVINNSGTISATGKRALDVTSTTAAVGTKITLNNFAGAVISTSGGSSDKDDVFRIDPDLPQGVVTVYNAGTIQTTGTSNDSQGLRFGKVYSDASITITNTATGLIKTANADAIRAGNNSTITNAGTIIAQASTDPSPGPLYSAHNAIDISIGQNATVINTGTITGDESALGTEVSYNGLKTAATDLPANYTVTNRAGGTLTGNNSGAIVSTGTATVVNEAGGTIKGLGAGSYNGGATASSKANYDGDGIDVAGLAQISNAGLIQGVRSAGINNTGRNNYSEGLDIGGGTVVNSGKIEGGSFGITVNNTSNSDQTRSGTGALTLTNQAGGVIVGDTGYAIRSENKTPDGSAKAALTNDTVTNYGTIIGNGSVPTRTVYLNGGTTTADPNTIGTLNGATYTSAGNAGSARFILGDGAAIQLGEGDDTLTNYGTITGNSGRAISLEGGNDTLNLMTGGTVTGLIDGGTGTDTLNLGLGTASASGTLVNVVNFEVLNVTGGTWTAADAESFANGVTIAAGAKLVVGAAGSVTGSITDNGTLAFAHADTFTVSGTIGGSGSVVQAGSGTLVLSGANTYSGGTALNSGSLDIAAAGAAGSGAITFGSGAETLHIEAAALTQSGGAASFGNILANFNAQDTLDIGGIGTATGVAYDATAHTLTVTGGTETVTLQLDAAATPGAGYAYGVVSDGNGGSTIAIEAMPTVTGLSANPASGALKAGQIVNFTLTTSSAVTVSGAAPVLHLNDGGTATYDAVHSTPTSLVFTYTVAGGENAASLSLTGVDNAASVQDAAHVGLDFGHALNQAGIGPQIDTTPPVVGFTSAGGLTNQATQTISGTIGAVDAGATVTLTEGGTVLGTAIAGSDGSWSAAVIFTGNGDHTVIASATDEAGNTGTSGGLTYTVDTTPPTVTFTSAGGLTNHANQTVSGTVDSGHAGLTVTIAENGAAIGSATVQADGSWSTGVSLSGDGVHTLLASDTDLAGNTGTSAPLRFTLDTAAPVIALTSTGGLTNQLNQTVAGTVGTQDAGSTVSISDNGQVVGTATVQTDGTWSTKVVLSGDGAHTLVASDTDQAGNTGHSANLTYTLDTTAPTVAVTSSGGLTNQSGQTITGTVGAQDAGSTVTLTDAGQVVGTATVQTDGTWSTKVTLAGDGTHSLVATDTDQAGNTGTSATVSYTLDTTAPTVTLTSAGGLTNQPNQTVTGKVGVQDAGSVVTVTDNGHAIGTATVQGDGSWSTKVTLAGDGTHSLVATDTDQAGNTGHSATVTATLDTTAPDIDFTSYGGTVHSATQTVRGTVGVEDAGATVTIFENQQLVGTAVVRGDGRWSSTVTLSGDGTHTLTASATDAAGNTGTTDESLSYSLSATSLTFDTGNLVLSVYGNSDGSGPYGDNNATPITLEQITTGGDLVSRFVLPQTTTVTNGVTNSVISGEYGSSSEGSLQLSGDGHWLVIGGYGINADTYNDGGAAIYGDARLAQSTSVQGGQYTAVPRVIAKIGADGSVDTSTILYNVYNTNNPRSIATVDGSDFYISGQGKKGDTTQGVFLVHDGGTTATSIDHSTDTRTIEIVDGQLYVSRDSKQGTGGTSNLGTYGALPTGATVATPLNGISTSVQLGTGQGNNVNGSAVGTKVALSPENFFFANATTLYIADSGNPKQGGLGDGGLQKWVYQGSQWVLQYTLSDGLNLVPNSAAEGTTGLIGLTGRVVGGTVELYATNSTVGDTDQTYVFGIHDQLAATSGAGESFVTLVTADENTNIRGISFAPTPVGPQVTLTATGGLTNQAAQTLAGTAGKALAGTIVSILDGNTVIGTATVQGDGTWSTKVTLAGDGTHSLTATDADQYGTVGTSAAVTYTLDTTAPTITLTSAGGLTNQASQTISGTVGAQDAGTTVTVTENGQAIGTAIVQGDGTWSTKVALFGDGTHSLVATDTDQAGNTGTSTTVSYTLDTAAPVVTLTSAGGLTNQPNQTVTGKVGTQDAGTTVTLSDNGKAIGTAIVQSDGTWSTKVALSGDGTHTLVATDTDQAGNTGTSTAVTYTLDTAAPTVSLTSAGGLTNQPNQTITGSVGAQDAGSTVTLTDNGKAIGTATVQADGTWSTTVALSGDGAHSLVASDTDQAGNTGTSTAVSYTLDTAAPVVTLTSAGGLTNQPSQTITGKVGMQDAGTTVTLTDNGKAIGTATVQGDGTWSTKVALSGDGTHSLFASDTDQAGNTGTSSAVSYTLDTTAPVIGLTSAGGLTNKPSQTIAGSVGAQDAGSTVTLTDNGKAIGKAVVQGDGTWSAKVTLSGDGQHSLVAFDTDKAGNTGTSAAVTYTLDTAAPTVSLTSAGGLTNQTNQTISGKVGVQDAGSTVTVNDNGKAIGTATVQTDGTWSTKVTLSGDGAHSLVATDTDQAGNTGTSSAVTYTLDTAAPTVSLTSAGGLTNKPSQTITGKVGAQDAGTTVTLTDNGKAIGTALVQKDGTWSIKVTLSGDGPHSFVASDTDKAGNTGTSAAVTYTLDTAAPTVSLTSAGGLTNQPNQTISGKVGVQDAGSTVTLTDNGKAIGTATVQADGTWSTKVTLSGEGTHSFVASDTDKAGNTGTSAPVTYTLDTTAPTITLTSAGGLTNKPSQTITGKVGAQDAGSTVTVNDNGKAIGTALVQKDGTWSTKVTLSGDGQHSLVASDTDKAGNTGVSAPITYSLDTTAPVAPSLLIAAPVGNALPRPALTGVAEAGTTVSLYDGSVVVATAVADAATGAFSFATLPALSAGTHTLTARAQDAAGNLSVSSIAETVTVNGAGTPTAVTQFHADKSKDVFLFNVTGKSYAAEHDVYNAAQTITEVTRTHTDGTFDYHFVLAADGTKTTDQYDAGGVLSSHVVVSPTGLSDSVSYANVGGKAVLASKTIKYAPGGSEVSNVKVYATASGQPVLTSETQVHADQSKDVYLSHITGKTYTAEHDAYNAAGKLAFVDQTNGDGSHAQTASLTGVTLTSTATASDLFKSVGSDTFVFAAGFGKDTILNFRPGSASGHDTLVIDRSESSSFADLQASHMSMSGNDTLITLSSTDSIFLKNVKIGQLSSDDFHFQDHGLFHA
ncbi:beta strand repeat-containing protein [Methylobacterium sp. SD21]|uniref:beta strand repeat-containing protein n=1 Tax=Methylobacterium litchii TaxID=3138810 RepID=UPI00313B7D5E